MSKSVLNWVLTAALCVECFAHAYCQDNSYVHLGLEAFKNYSGSNLDHIQPLTGNLYLQIPLVSFPQKGTIPLSFSLRTNSASWQYESSCSDITGSCFEYYTNVVEGAGLGANYTLGPGTGLIYSGVVPGLYLSSNLDVSSIDTTFAYVTASTCNGDPACSEPVTFGGLVTDSTGGRHGLSLDPNDNTLRANDGSGYVQSSFLSTTAIPLTDSSGNTYTVNNGAYIIKDPNGNEVQRTTTGWSGQIIDTVARSIPDINSLVVAGSTEGCPVLDIANEPLSGSAAWTVPGLHGISQTYLFCYTNISISTNFFGLHGGQTCNSNSCTTEAKGVVPDIQSVVLPDGTYWSFVYDTASPTNEDSYGDLLSITFPTGGSLSYTYETVSSYAYGFTRGIVSRTVDDANGNVGKWIYNLGAVATVTDPQNNDIVYTYDQSHYEGTIPVETDRKYYQGKAIANVLLKEVATQYEWIQDPSVNQYAPTNFVPNFITTKTPAGSSVSTIGYDQQSLNEDHWCYYGLYSGTMGNCYTNTPEPVLYEMPTLTTLNNYDGSLLRQLRTRRLANPTGAVTQPPTNPYYEANLLNLTYNNVTSDATSNFEDGFGYDEVELGPSCYCGNQTSHSEIDVTSTVPANRWTTVYNMSGMPTSETDANGNSGGQYPGGRTIYGYDALDLFLANATYPSTGIVSHMTSQVQDDNTGAKITTTDENKNVTQFFYYTTAGANANRIQQIELPDGASLDFTYNNIPGRASVTETSVTDAASDTVSVRTTYVDGFGRAIHQTRDDAFCTTGVVTNDILYDTLGRVQAKSSPYCLQSDPTYNLTSYQYDALGRVILETHTDGTSRQRCYDGQQIIGAQLICTAKKLSSVSGDWEDVSDESSFGHQYIKDALGRLAAVVEPSGNTGGSIATTIYSYDALDHLTGVQQSGSSATMMRSFHYDQFGRLYSSKNPETSLITYAVYDPNGNVISRSDARGVITAYSYDALNRLISKTYSGTNAGANAIVAYSLSSCYQYDTNAPTVTEGNLMGRLTNAWTIRGTCSGSVPSSGYQTLHSILAYDPLGRIQTENQCTPANCFVGASYSLTFGYDYGGNLTHYTNGAGGLAFTQQYDSANRLLNISSSWVDATHPEGLFNVQNYNPYGMSQFSMGEGIVIHRTYDSRMRVSGETAIGVQ